MTQRTERISASVSSKLKRRVEEEALERSEVGDRVTSSDVIREALADHFEEEQVIN